MNDVNSYQIGGDHYADEYQPWDFILDLDLNFLLANAVKYIFRHQKKGGAEDLAKAIHYLDKAAIENKVAIRYPFFYKLFNLKWLGLTSLRDELIETFTNQLECSESRKIIRDICMSDHHVDLLIASIDVNILMRTRRNEETNEHRC